MRPPKSLRRHPHAGLIPSMSPDEATSLDADVARRGIVVPIEITVENVIVDGHQRHGSALRLGLEQVPVRIVCPPDEVDYMYSAAIERRQLEKSQRAALALLRLDYLEQTAAAAVRKNANLRNNSLDVAKVPHRGLSRKIAAEFAGVSERLIQDAIKVQRQNPGLFKHLIAGDLTANRALQIIERETRYASIGAAPPLPPFTYQVILADPPWNLGSNASASAPDQHYPTLPVDDIAALPVPSAPDALLYLWAVNSHLREALHVMEAWGFEYRSNEVWVKQSIGRGVWTRHQHELLLIGRKGSARPAHPNVLASSVITADRREHSRKPDIVYDRLDFLYPERSKLELYARSKRPNWTSWGNQVNP